VKVIVYKSFDGRTKFAVKRTRRGEGPSVIVHDIAKEQVKDELAQAIALVKPPKLPEF